MTERSTRADWNPALGSNTVSRMETIETIVDQLDRLKRHVGALRNGQTSARDDAATVLHLLVGKGEGYGRLYDAARSLGDDGPRLPVWADPGLVQGSDGLPVIVGLRGVADVTHIETVRRPIPTFLDEVCLRHAVPGVESQADRSWRDVIRHVRNKFGSHADRKPPQWLRDLRYYPAADSDVVPFLMWSVGEAVLEASTEWLRGHRVDIERHQSQQYLDGVRLHQANVLYDDTALDVRAQLQIDNWASGRRRAIVGGLYSNKPFIFGVGADGSLLLDEGKWGMSLRDFHQKFRTSGSPMQPNRKQRRAAQKKRDK